MAAITDVFNKAVNYVMDTFGVEKDDAFREMAEDEDYGYEDGYIEEGSALRKPEPAYSPVFETRTESKVISHPSLNRGGNEIVFVEPRSFDDAATIVQYIKDRKIVMLNLHLLDKEQSQRTIDFICGAAQALNGTPRKVDDLVFCFAPSNVTLSAEMQPQTNKFDDSIWRPSLQ